MGKTALIGYTGFVGSNLQRSHQFDDCFNTSNIEEIRGRRYDVVVSAAGRADSHRINEDPDQDRDELERYAELLRSVSIDELVHVSTVCVYGASDRCDEDTVSDPETLTPYGRNRRWLEEQLASTFPTLRLRLPQLFGPGIKKGLVHDLAKDHRVEFIRPDGVFQYYDLARLWSDIDIARRAGLSVLNLATPPIVHRDLASDVFGTELDETRERPDESPFASMYTRNMTTRHASLFGRSGDYLMTRDEEIDAIRSFVGLDGPAGVASLGERRTA